MDHSEPNISISSKNKHRVEIAFVSIIGVALGYLIISQSYSVDDIYGIVARDRETNVFREMQIIYDKNRELSEEIADLEDTAEQYSHRASSLEAANLEIKKYEGIAGLRKVSGAGVEVVISTNENIGEVWFVDLVNELLNGGAEAISIQNIRLVEGNVGFDRLPNGQIFLGGTPLSSPYVLKVVGSPNELIDSLDQPRGVLERIKKAFLNIDVQVSSRELVEIDKAI